MLVGLTMHPIFSMNSDPNVVAELGNSGWDWKGLRPYYKKVWIR
jgi:hypothetical protein